jgi:hypothetical protein
MIKRFDLICKVTVTGMNPRRTLFLPNGMPVKAWSFKAGMAKSALSFFGSGL